MRQETLQQKDQDRITKTIKIKGKADVIYMIATYVIFLKSLYISQEIGYIFCILMLLTQLFMRKF